MNVKRIYEPISHIAHKIFRPKNRIYHANSVCYAGSERLKISPQLTEDVFEKAKTSVSDVISKLDVNSFINEKYYIGEGATAAVYRLGDTPYLLKVPHIGWIQGKLVKGKSVNVTKLDLSATPKDKINNIVGHIGNAEILRYIEGKNTISDLASSSEVGEAINNLTIDNIKQYFSKLSEANRVGLRHDYFGNNCIINCSTGKLTPIDFLTGHDYNLLDSLICSCGSFPEHIGGKKAQNTLLVKGLTAIFEMVRDGKLLSKEVDIAGDVFTHPGLGYIEDKRFARYVKRLCNSFTKDSSSENIDKLLKELSEL